MNTVVSVVLLIATVGVPMSSTQDDALWLARAVQGEVGIMGEQRAEAGSWVVHVALNRAASPWFPNNIAEVIQKGFWGAHGVTKPEEWAWKAVEDALGMEDPTRGALFFFGGSDLNRRTDWSSHRGSLRRDGWWFSVHVFARWPFIVAKQEDRNDTNSGVERLRRPSFSTP